MKYISIITTILLLLLCSSTISAQSVALKGGASLSNLFAEDEDGNYGDEYKNRIGFHAGLEIVSPINEKISYKTGALLTTKGAHYDDSFEGMNIKGEINLLYLDIPLTMMLKVPTETAVIYGNFGPYIGIGLTGTFEDEFEGGGISSSDKFDINWGSDEDEDDLRRLDYGLIIGGGIDFGPYALEAAYNYGLANISAYRDFDNKVSNRLITISIIYKINR